MIWVRWETVYILVSLLPPIHPCSVKKATPVCLNYQPPSVSECVVFSIYIAEAGSFVDIVKMRQNIQDKAERGRLPHSFIVSDIKRMC